MKATILLAEDEQAMREVLTDYFTAKSGGDFTVVPAPDGDTALHLIETRRFDLLLLDIMLPEIDGLEILHMLRENPATKHLPVMMLTAISTSTTIRPALVTAFWTSTKVLVISMGAVTL